MKRVFFAVMLFVLCSILLQGIVFAEEIYKDENGVWRNRPTSDEVLSEGARVVGAGAYDATRAGLERLIKLYSIPFQAPIKNWQRDMEKDVEKRRIQRADEKRIAEEKRRVGDISSYERFDASKAGEIKSEWEFFEDPR